MRDQLIKWILPTIIDSLLHAFPNATIKLWLDDMIDLFEVRIEQSESEIDDMLLPAVKAIRELFDIPDNDH